MSAITTHILDTSRGRPAADVAVKLEMNSTTGWRVMGQGVTDADGRLRTLLADDHALAAGTYRLEFATGAYFARIGVEGFFPSVTLTFEVRATSEHYHVPLLLNPFGYSTYRGS